MANKLNPTPFLDRNQVFVTPDSPITLFACNKESVKKAAYNNYLPRCNPVYASKDYNTIKPKIGDFNIYTSYSRRAYKNFVPFSSEFKAASELHLRAQFSLFTILKKIKAQYDSIPDNWHDHLKFMSFYKPGNIVPRAKRSDSLQYSFCKVDKVDTIVKDQKYHIHMTSFSNETLRPVNGRPMIYDVTIQSLRAFSNLLNVTQVGTFLTWQLANFKNSMLSTYLVFREFETYNKNKNNESENLSE